jgi:hypothetical protein
MRPLMRAACAAFLLFSAPIAAVSVASDAHASVSIAITFDALVKNSSAVAVLTPIEQKSVWEDGRIYTYTRAHTDSAVAGDATSGGEGWVRTMGGVVGNIGQIVEGEPVFTVGRPSLVFLQRGPAGSFEVTGRAQGQFAVAIDDAKITRLLRSSAVGALLAPKQNANASDTALHALAHEVLHSRRMDDGTKEIAAAWKRLHASK